MAGYETFRSSETFTGAGSFAGDNLGLDIGADGFNAGLFAGYGQRINHDFYLGAEIEGDLANTSTDAHVTVGANSATATVKHNNDYAGSIRAGVFPTENTLLYGRIGAVESNFNGGTSVNLTGVRFGLGSETAINPNMTLRADWVYSGYGSYTFTNANGSFTSTPDSNTFRIGLAYSF